MGESQYSWHAFGPAGGSPAGPPRGTESMPPHIMKGSDVFSYVVRFDRHRVRRTRVCRYLRRRSHGFALVGVAYTVGVWYVPWRGVYPLALFKGAATLREPFCTWSQPEWSVKRRSANPVAPKDGPIHLAPVESKVFGSLFNLVAHCAETRYEDGESRQTGWFTIKTMGAAWTVQIKDPDSACQLQVTAATLDDALALADVLLGAEEAPWEPDRFLKAQQQQKKK